MSGTSLDIDRERVQTLLGFHALCENTIDSVSASDHVFQAAAALASTMNIVARLSQDLYIWSSQEYALIDVTDAFASPSSLMPQKKNALVLEYVRARAARTIGSLAGCFAVMQNVGYMDTEEVEIESYVPLYEAFDIADQALAPIAALLPALQVEKQRMRERAAWGFSSVTALAEEIQTKERLSYRTAHRIVARAVLTAENGKDATGIDAALVDAAAGEMIDKPLRMSDEAIRRCLDPRHFVEQHKVTGAAAPSEVRRMAGARRDLIARDEAAVAERATRIRNADRELRAAVEAFLNSER
jgi:argininosuccinate lyase